MPSTVPTFKVALAPLEDWAPLNAIWPDDYTPTPEEQAWRDEGITASYKAALRRRSAARSYAKARGRPMPSLDDPLVPGVFDHVWEPKPPGPIDPPPRPKVSMPPLPPMDRPMPPVTEEDVRRAKEREARWEEEGHRFRERRTATNRAYNARKKAKKLGRPLPPTVAQLEQEALRAQQAQTPSQKDQ